MVLLPISNLNILKDGNAPTWKDGGGRWGKKMFVECAGEADAERATGYAYTVESNYYVCWLRLG